MQANIPRFPQRFESARDDFYTAHEFAGPIGRAAVHFQHQRRTGFRQRFRRDYDNGRRGIFDGAAQAEPGRQRNAARVTQRRIAEIEENKTEAAGLDDKIGDFKRALGIASAAYPEEAVETDTGLRCGGGIEGA